MCNNNKYLAAINPRISFQFHSFCRRRYKYAPFLAHEVLAFALLRLMGVACPATCQLQHKLNRCLYSLDANFCMGAYKPKAELHRRHRCLHSWDANFVWVVIIQVLQYDYRLGTLLFSSCLTKINMLSQY